MTDERVEEIIDDMCKELALHAVINAASETAAYYASVSRKWRDRYTNPDRRKTAELITLMYQRDAAEYYKLAIELRLQLL